MGNDEEATIGSATANDQAPSAPANGEEDEHCQGLMELDAVLPKEDQESVENVEEDIIDFNPRESQTPSVFNQGLEDDQGNSLLEPVADENCLPIDSYAKSGSDAQINTVEEQGKQSPTPASPSPSVAHDPPAPQFLPGRQRSNNTTCSSTDADTRRDFVFEATGQQDEISTLGGYSLEPRPRPPIIPVMANYDDVSTLGDSTLDPYANQRYRGYEVLESAGRRIMPYYDANQIHPPYWRPMTPSEQPYEKPPPVAMVATEDTSKERDSFDDTASYNRCNWRRFAYIAFFVLGPLLVGGIVVLALLLTGHLKVDGAALLDNTVALEGSGLSSNEAGPGPVSNGVPTLPTEMDSTAAPTFNMTNSSSFEPSQYPTVEPLPSDAQEEQLETEEPTSSPAEPPTDLPTSDPTSHPTIQPSPRPTRPPTPRPTRSPSFLPTTPPMTPRPTDRPTVRPTASPTPDPTPSPTLRTALTPTPRPSPQPTQEPTPQPVADPTPRPTPRPTRQATREPTRNPTAEPTRTNTERPTREPIVVPAVPLVLSQPPFPELRFVSWSNFQRRTHPQVVDAVTDALQYTESTWNTPGSASIEGSSYATVYRRSPIHAFALWNLGFQSSPPWNCWINHYMAFSWDQINFLPSASQADGLHDLVSFETNYGRNVRNALEILGWTRESWADNSPSNWPASFRRSWNRLTSTEQQAARVLCYDQAIWDEDPIPNW